MVDEIIFSFIRGAVAPAAYELTPWGFKSAKQCTARPHIRHPSFFLGPNNCHTCGVDGNPPARLVWHGREPARTTTSTRTNYGPHVRCMPTPPALPRPGKPTRCPHDQAVPGLRSIPSLVCRHRPPPLEPRPPSPAFSGCHGNQSRSVGQTHRKPHPNPPHRKPPTPTQPFRDDQLKSGENLPISSFSSFRLKISPILYWIHAIGGWQHQ